MVTATSRYADGKIVAVEREVYPLSKMAPSNLRFLRAGDEVEVIGGQGDYHFEATGRLAEDPGRKNLGQTAVMVLITNVRQQVLKQPPGLPNSKPHEVGDTILCGMNEVYR